MVDGVVEDVDVVGFDCLVVDVVNVVDVLKVADVVLCDSCLWL